MPPTTAPTHPIASAAVFCPQSKAPSEVYLDSLHTYLTRHPLLHPTFTTAIATLHDTVWSPHLAAQRTDIADLGQGPRYLANLCEWIETGKSSKVANMMSGIMTLPLLVVMQVCQYFQYLELHGVTHAQFLEQLKAGGGIQGYCGGLPPGVAVACSKTEEEVVENACVALRIALAIGAYGELGDDESVPGATTIVVRVKKVGQGEGLVENFPGAYISAITDPKTISVVGPVPVLLKLQVYAREQGFLVQEMHIRGKVHNPENADLAQELCQLCDKTKIFQLPQASRLQVPVRSNKTGALITEGSLTNEIVSVILASRCEWFSLLTEMAKDLDLTGRRTHTFATFGIGDCIPLSPFHKHQLQITKVEVQSLIAETTHTARDNNPDNSYAYSKDAVAIVGASCRLPGASSMDELWDLISSGTSQHSEVPTDRFDLPGSFRASQDRKFTEKRKFYGNFIDQVGNYDHAFFKTNPKEALNMDPQQRVLLELAFQAMDSSGYLASHKREAGDPVGCFIGASFAEYLDNTNAHPPTAYTSTGTIRAFLCGRISYYFGWSGPAEVVDTACSSSLVAIHRACKAVQTGECTMALAGGVNIMTGMNNFLDLAKAGFLSPTGQCKPFDQSADGYCRSEGGALVVLKQLRQAVADGDQILGVIPGIATNQGGLSSSITIPHSPAQKKLYQTVLRQANLTPEQVSYVEAHGTGTQAGDPLEVASIREVFGGKEREHLLNIGSLKGNIGHAETAAGAASLLKILTMLQNAKIPPQASHNSLNPKIPQLGVDKMTIASKISRWQVPLLAACVNSYGAAGSNCALVCTEGPPQKAEASKQIKTAEAGLTYPILVSAASAESLATNVEGLGEYLQKLTPKPNLGDVAFTLSKRRKIHRRALVTTATDVDMLARSLKGEVASSFEMPSTPKRVILAFGGQTKKTVDMDRRLYEAHPHFRSYVDECDKIVQQMGFVTFFPHVFESENLSDVVTLQCGTFALQYACAKCWIDAGLVVDAVIGHSFGELTAMVISGVLSLGDGLKLIASRASLMKTKWGAENGTMLVVHGSQENVRDIVAGVNAGSSQPEVEIACYNAPSSQVVVGGSAAIDRTEALLKTDDRFSGIRCQRLDVTHGFHSRFTDGILHDLDQVSASLTYSSPEIPLESCTSTARDQILASRPSQHAREPVYFMDAVQRIESRLGPCVWLEAGMDSPAIPMIKRASARPDDHSFLAVKIKEAHTPANDVMSNLTADLWRQGIMISHWNFLQPRKNAYKQIWLPPYQFQPTRHWLDNVDRVLEAQRNASAVEKTTTVVEKVQEEPKAPPKLVEICKDAGKNDRSKEFDISLATQRFTKIVSGHAVRQRPLCPASMYMECAAMGLQLLQGDLSLGTLGFTDLSFQAALGVDLARKVSLTLERSNDSQAWNFVIKSVSKNDARSRSSTHAKGKIMLSAPTDFKTYERLINDRLAEMAGRSNLEKLMSNRAYGLFAQVVHYADFLHGIANITMGNAEAKAEIIFPEEARFGLDESSVTQSCDTIAIDMFIQVVGLLINSSDLVTSEDVYVATGVDNITMSAACDFHTRSSWIVYTKYTVTGDGTAAGDVFVMTSEGVLLMMISGAQFTKLLISKLERFLDSANPAAKPTPSPAAPTLYKQPQVPVEVSTALSSTASSEGLDTPPNTDDSSATSLQSDDEPQTPDELDDGAEKTLRSIMASYTGIAPEDIAQEAGIGDLGVDSLAAVELAEELQAHFHKEIEAEDFLQWSFGKLSDFLIPQQPRRKKLAPTGAAKGNRSPATPPSQATSGPPSSTDAGSEISEGLQKTLKLLSETSGAPVASINPKSTLSELGIDSLSAVELKSDLEDAFKIEIEDDRFTPDSTVKEVFDFLGLSSKPTPSQAKPATAQVIPQSSAPTSKPPQSSAVHQLGSPMEALTACEGAFDQSASQRGFTNYWASVAPAQDSLLLAYINEAFLALGCNIAQTARGETVPSIKHLPKHAKVMERLFQILAKHDILTRHGPKLIRGGSAPPALPSSQLHQQFMRDFPAYVGEARLMALTGPKLADCLTGKADPVGLMFRGKEAQQVMGDYYTASPMLSTLTEQMVVFLRAVLTSSSSVTAATPIRILEVGAGFGGTTTRLAEVIEASGVPVVYKFTDISPSLVKGAKAKFGARYPWMEFQALNLETEMPAPLQGMYDVVIGTNCVHATTNKTKTIGRLRSLLNSTGFVVLSEVTQLCDWYDIVFGLLDGWWLANDGSTYPLQPPSSWVRSFEDGGFAGDGICYTQGPNPESNTQRLLVASNDAKVVAPKRQVERVGRDKVKTVVWKEVDGVKIEADVYLPPDSKPDKALPVALMIHGGGHMTLSRKAIRPRQTEYLLAHDVLPVSIDYRLCPEINLIDGPMADVRDALVWAQNEKGLQAAIRDEGVMIDEKRVVMIGWSTGGHLAMTTAWTSQEAGLKPPMAILSFYGPTDFVSGELDQRRAEMYPERQMSMSRIISSLPTKPISTYTTSISPVTDSSHLGWIRPGDPRSELVLSLFKEGHGLPLLLNGIRPSSTTWSTPPSLDRIRSICPITHLQAGTYKVPTFMIHGTEDEIVPVRASKRFWHVMQEKGLRGGMSIVEGATHIHDLGLAEGDEGWEVGVGVGYEFLLGELAKN